MSPQPDIASNPEVQELTAQTDQFVVIAQSYVVHSPDQYVGAGNDLKRVKEAQKRLDDLRRSMTRPLDVAKKVIMDFFRAPEEKLARAESGIKRSMLAYSAEQERLRQEEQRRAEEAARKEQDRLAAQAQRAADRGQHTRAEALQDRAASVVAPLIQREAPTVSGISTREVWKYEVTDAAALPREYTMADDKKIGGVVRAMKGDTNIAGVRVWKEQTLAAGSAA